MSDEERIVVPPEPSAETPPDTAAAPPEPVESPALPEAKFGLPPAESDLQPPAEPVFELPELEPPTPPGQAPDVELPPAPPEAPAPSAGDISDDDRLMAALSWVVTVILQLPVLSVVLLLIEPNKNRPFQRHHAVTSIVFWIAAIAYEVLAAIVYTILGILTLGCGLACLWVLFLVPHAVALYYALQAYNGKRLEIPVLTDFIRTQGWA